MVFGMLCLGGCPRPDTQQLEWPYGAIFEYKENAIKLEVDADRELNRYQGDANSLHLCMYQLRNPNELNRLSNNEDGLYQLLSVNCGFSDGSVANATPMTVQPGEKETYIYNRAEDARYVAFVAGYYALERERIIRLVRVPVVLVKKSTGFFSSTQVPKVPNMQVKLKLGPEQIISIDVIPGR
jgi:type VI secretion system VasD/TssJ family lipoprotein